MHKRSMDTGEGTASGANIGHDWAIFRRSVFRKLGRVADDPHAVADLAHHGERAIQQGLAAKLQKGFIDTRAHAGTLASGEEEAHARPFGSCGHSSFFPTFVRSYLVRS